MRLVQLSGPSHAEEVARGLPTACVAASTDRDAAELVQDSFMNPMFRLYTSSDLLRWSSGRAQERHSPRRGHIRRHGLRRQYKGGAHDEGITEIARLGTKLGGLRETFGGLSGIGDLIVTCTSMHSRNRRAGILIGQGLSPEKAVEQVGTWRLPHRARGVRTRQIGRRRNAHNKRGIQRAFRGKDCRSTMIDLMTRRKTHETELLWL